MFRTLFFLFLVIPIVEIALLIQLSEIIGGWSTIFLVIFTAYFGAKLVKQQGLQAMQEIQLKLASGQLPGNELFAGVCILISGVLLVTPGVMTDIFGFLLLTPAFRDRLAKVLKERVQLQMVNGNNPNFGFSAFTQQESMYSNPHSHQRDNEEQQFMSGEQFRQQKEQPSHQQPNTTLEGEFQRKDD